MEEIFKFQEKNETVSTLDTPGINNDIRCFGNTTKQIDFAVQKLFEGYKVKCIDHYCVIKHINNLNKRLIKRIMDRLDFEHNLKHRENYIKLKLDLKNDTLSLESV